MIECLQDTMRGNITDLALPLHLYAPFPLETSKGTRYIEDHIGQQPRLFIDYL